MGFKNTAEIFSPCCKTVPCRAWQHSEVGGSSTSWKINQRNEINQHFSVHIKVNQPGLQRERNRSSSHDRQGPPMPIQTLLCTKKRATLSEHLLKVTLAHQVPNTCMLRNFQIGSIWGYIYLVK